MSNESVFHNIVFDMRRVRDFMLNRHTEFNWTDKQLEQLREIRCWANQLANTAADTILECLMTRDNNEKR